MMSAEERRVSVSKQIALCVDGRCPHQKGRVLSERTLFQRLSRHDVPWDNVVSDKLEGEMEQAKSNEQMVVEKMTSNCEAAVQ